MAEEPVVDEWRVDAVVVFDPPLDQLTRLGVT